MLCLKIRLRSDLCAGSGESFGNVIDSDICMDESGLPYIPARRIKGCLRQAAADLQRYSGNTADYTEQITHLFGEAYTDEGCLSIQNAYLEGTSELKYWLHYAVPDILKPETLPGNMVNLFTYIRGQTKMKDGVKDDSSLRFTRVMNQYNPLYSGKECELFAPISLNSNKQEDRDFLKMCCKAFRHMGSNRNRGLGNVVVTLEERKLSQKMETSKTDLSLLATMKESEKVCITYQLNLNAPIALQGCGEQLTAIPAASVIGCLAGQYLRQGSAEDAAFQALFLDGTVSWSALTPVIEEKISVPTPIMLAYKKCSHVYVNRITFSNEEQEEQNREKIKLLNGTYSVQNPDGYSVASVNSHTVYHHQHRNNQSDGMLYMQEALDAGMVYGGTVLVPVCMAEQVCSLLTAAEFRFGRSRNAQYAACSLAGAPQLSKVSKATVPSSVGEAIFVILESDMLLMKDGQYVLDNEGTRAAIGEILGLDARLQPDKQMDYCLFSTVSGFQMQWNMQKEQLPVINGGSMFCFVSDGRELPETFRLGELEQEGFGQCRVITSSGMNRLNTIRRSTVKQKALADSARYSGRMQTLLIVAAAKKAMLQTAQSYASSAQTKQLDTGQIRRLRLMLDEAKDYADLIRRVRNIKNSDTSSENPAGRGEKTLHFVTKFYGKNDLCLNKLIAKKELWELLKQDVDAQKLVMEQWKLPMKKVLHLAYYKREG